MSNQELGDEEIESLRGRINELRIEHRDLDLVISRLSENIAQDQLQLRRLKKRKLQLKDTIAKLEDRVIPDIIA
ncbi:MAG: YdcH family protein [Burkholderiales bacterium]